MKERNYGMDLLKIVSMIMIVILHILNKGGIIEQYQPFSIGYELTWLLHFFCICSVNCYAMISGYVMCGSSIKYQKIIVFWIQTVFYCAIITALFCLFSSISFERSLKLLIRVLFPVSTGTYWYFTAYFGLFFVIPILNLLIKFMSKKQYVYILTAGLCLFSLFPISWVKDPFYIRSGYSMVWLIFMYLLGGFINKQNVFDKYSSKHGLSIYLFSVLLLWFIRFMVDLISLKIPYLRNFDFIFTNYNFPVIVSSSIGLLLFFGKLQIVNKKQINIIHFFSPLSFSVYLIHVHPLIFDHIIYNGFIKYTQYPIGITLLCIFVTALFIYIICVLIDWMRLELFYYFKVEQKSKHIAGKARLLFDKFYQYL